MRTQQVNQIILEQLFFLIPCKVRNPISHGIGSLGFKATSQLEAKAIELGKIRLRAARICAKIVDVTMSISRNTLEATWNDYGSIDTYCEVLNV